MTAQVEQQPSGVVHEGWWHPNVKSGQVHDHTNKQPQTMHRLCEPVYTHRFPDWGDRVAFIEAIAREEIATGISSRAMAFAVLGWRDGVGSEMPYDRGDWGRCVRTYEAAPPHLRERMEPIMDLYYQRLCEYNEKVGAQEWRMRNVVWPLP